MHAAAGYFVFDPQCEKAWDPTETDSDPELVYLPMQPAMERSLAAHTAVPATVAAPMVEHARKREAKPWWKFW